MHLLKWRDFSCLQVKNPTSSITNSNRIQYTIIVYTIVVYPRLMGGGFIGFRKRYSLLYLHVIDAVWSRDAEHDEILSTLDGNCWCVRWFALVIVSYLFITLFMDEISVLNALLS